VYFIVHFVDNLGESTAMELASHMVNRDRVIWPRVISLLKMKLANEFMIFPYEVNNESAIAVAVVSWLMSESLGFTIWILVERSIREPRS
jgi:hypothetical protein